MRSFNFLLTLLFALFATSYAWVDTSGGFTHGTLEARKGNKGNNTNGGGNGDGNTANKACKTLAKLTKLTELAANQTKLDAQVAKGKLTTEEVTEIKAKAANATTELQTMQSNTTLVQECETVAAHKAVVKSCKQMNKLEELANIASNQTAMDALVAKKGLNDTQVSKLMEKAANATTKLTEMQANTTLTDLCAQEQSQKGAANGATGGAASASGSAAPAQSTGGAGSLAGRATQTAPLIAAVGAVFAFL
jgi:midasin (ATPase involved in ribosome maturation)